MLARSPRPEIRFHISTLEIEDEHVFLTLENGCEVVGRMFLTNGGKQRFEQFNGGRRYERLHHKDVCLWRPIDATWPFRLPEATAVLTKDIHKPVAVPRNGEATVSDGPWLLLSHKVHLGSPADPPVSIEEVEARLLRCLRTRAVLDRETRRIQSAWARPLVDSSKAIAQTLRATLGHYGVVHYPGYWTSADQDDYHVDASELEARPARFTPTPRDVSDYEAAIDQRWLAHVWKRNRHLYQARAMLPPLQWWGLADDADESVVKQRYRDGLKMIFAKVKT